VPGLAHPRFAAQNDHASVAAKGGEERILQDGKLGFAPDQVRAEHTGEGHD
jgi:hypothetical protein